MTTELGIGVLIAFVMFGLGLLPLDSFEDHYLWGFVIGGLTSSIITFVLLVRQGRRLRERKP